MGRGDRRSRKGKIWRGTSGKYRLKMRKRSKTMQNARPATAST